MNFTIVVLNEHITFYSQFEWTVKDDNRKLMASQGDHWSQTMLKGKTSGIALKATSTRCISCNGSLQPRSSTGSAFHPIPTLRIGPENSPSVTPRSAEAPAIERISGDNHSH